MPSPGDSRSISSPTYTSGSNISSTDRGTSNSTSRCESTRPDVIAAHPRTIREPRHHPLRQLDDASHQQTPSPMPWRTPAPQHRRQRSTPCYHHPESDVVTSSLPRSHRPLQAQATPATTTASPHPNTTQHAPRRATPAHPTGTPSEVRVRRHRKPRNQSEKAALQPGETRTQQPNPPREEEIRTLDTSRPLPRAKYNLFDLFLQLAICRRLLVFLDLISSWVLGRYSEPSLGAATPGHFCRSVPNG